MKKRWLPTGLLMIIGVILTNCQGTDDCNDYLNNFTGNWQFTVYRESWGYQTGSHQYDTMEFKGFVTFNTGGKGLLLNYFSNSSLSVWVEEGVILKDAIKLGNINEFEMSFTCLNGTITRGTSDKVNGLRSGSVTRK